MYAVTHVTKKVFYGVGGEGGVNSSDVGSGISSI